MVGVGKVTQETDFIVGNPQITFFKAVYRRHSHFAIQQKLQSGDQPNVNGKEIVYTVNDGGGQLLHRCWLEVDLKVDDTHNPDLSDADYINWTNNTGHALVEQVKLKINNNEIDTHSGVWLDVYNELNDKEEYEHFGINKHSAKNEYLTSNTGSLKPLHLIIPFKFWFNRNPGLALPLCSIDRSSVDFVVKFRKLNHLVNTTNEFSIPTGVTIEEPTVKFFSEIIHLDIDETRRFTQNRHEYLIETVQEKQEDFDTSVRINFSHPVKELIWVIRHSHKFEGHPSNTTTNNIDATQNVSYNSTGSDFLATTNNSLETAEPKTNGNDYFDYSCGSLGGLNGTDPHTPVSVLSTHGGNNIYGNNTTGCEWFNTFELDISGESQFDALQASFLRTSLPAQYGHKVPNKHVYSYSFSLNPNDYSPSGVKNLSNSSNQLLKFTNPITVNSDVKITIFAVNYNIFRIMNGKAALIFSQ
tara:strand:- start:222 stop:1634 length:1413 start_codon:yes stop_codon:yes gene_type:complete